MPDGPEDAPGRDRLVVLTVAAAPEHVRTARLVALAVARRCGLGVEVEDDVRLAVGEACSRAVRRSLASGTSTRVEVRLVAGDPGLDVVVLDDQGDQPLDEDDEVSLRLLQGLAPVVEITPHAVHLAWGAAAS